MANYYTLSISSNYWKPGTNFLKEILEISSKIKNDDFIVISEKAISVALGNIVDEKEIKPSRLARTLSGPWMRWGWGYFLGILCKFGPRLLQRLRNYPKQSGSQHKQLALERAGLIQALMFGSEGGIDGSNLPYAYVSMPLNNCQKIAEQIQLAIEDQFKKRINVLIVDSDKTYSYRNFHFTPRPKPLKGIHSFGGIVAYLLGRILKLRRRPTPLAATGDIVLEEALKISNVSDHARGPGSGETVWDMASRFNVKVNAVSWDMLSAVKHKPVILVRKKKNK